MSRVKIDTARIGSYTDRINRQRSKLKKLKGRLDILLANEKQYMLKNQIGNFLDDGIYALKKINTCLTNTQSAYEKLEKELERKVNELDSFRVDPFEDWINTSDNSWLKGLISANGDITSINGSLLEDWVPLPEWSVLSDWIVKGQKNYNGIFSPQKKEVYIPFFMSSEKENKKSVVDSFFDVLDNAGNLKDFAEGFTDIKIPDFAEDAMNYLSIFDCANSFTSGAYKYLKGFGDREWMTEGADDILDAIETFSGTAGEMTTGWDPASNVLLSFGKNIVSNWLEAIQSETKVEEVYWHTFANSTLETFGDVVCNDLTLAVAYIPARIISDTVGYDIQGEYERLSGGKKGFEAVTTCVSDLGEIIVENSSFENWKSGMKIMLDGIADFFKF